MVKVTAEQGLTATFKVYYKDGESGTLTEYEVDNQPVEYTLTPGQTVTIKNLPRTGANGDDRYYYLVETAVSDRSKSVSIPIWLSELPVFGGYLAQVSIV